MKTEVLRQWGWNFLHNAIAHPIMAFTPTPYEWMWKFHNWTAKF